LIFWDVETGKNISSLNLPDDLITCASFHPGGEMVVTGSRKSGITVWDIKTGAKKSEIKAIPSDLYSEKGFDYPEAGSVLFSSDGKFIIAGCGDNTAIIWDASTGKELGKFKKVNSTCTSCVCEAVITHDNKYIITANNDSVKVFDRATGALVRKFYGQGGEPEGMSVSSDNRYLTGIEYGVAELWDIQSGKLLLKAGDYSDNKIISVSVSPDCKQIITGSEKRVSEVWDISTGKKSLTLRGYLNQVNERILTHPYMYYAALVNEAKLSPDGKYIAVGRSGNNAKIIDFSTGKVLKTLTGHKGMVISLNFSKDSKYLATGGLDGKAIVWEVETGKPVTTISFPDENMAIFSVDISADGKMLATADWGGYVVIWDIASGKSLQAVSPHNRSAVYQVKFSPNGVYFISAGLDGIYRSY
jgi:WD40 repeat protein